MGNTTYPSVTIFKKQIFVPKVINDEIVLIEFNIAPGFTVPPHLHEESDEKFEITSGSITFKVNGETIVAHEGETVRVPKMTIHSVSNKTNAWATCMVTYSPVSDIGKFFGIGSFLFQENPKNIISNSFLFKLYYISRKMKHKPFSIQHPAIANTIFNMVFSTIFLVGAFLGWNKLVKKYADAEGGGKLM